MAKTATPADSGLSVDLGMLRSKYDEISTIDEKLAAASGNEAAGKRALANKIAEETSSTWNDTVTEMVNALSSIDDITALTGAVTGLRSKLNESFSKKIDEHLSKLVSEQKPDEAEKLSAEETESLISNRRALVDQYKALRAMLDLFGFDVDSVPEPKKMTGARGKRGPRVFKNFQFSIDDKELTANQNSLSAIANNMCKDLGWKVKDLHNFLSEQGIDIQNPPDEFEVTLPDPNGKKLSAKKYEVSEEDAEIEDEDGLDETED